MGASRAAAAAAAAEVRLYSEAEATARAALEAAATAAAAAAVKAARAFGDVAMQADGYTGKKAERLGVFELQAEVVQGRPTYKKRGEQMFLFYSTVGFWMVGPDTSKTSGGWAANSGAMTPGAITEAWQVYGGSSFVDVRAAKIVKRR